MEGYLMGIKTNWGLRPNDFIKESREGHPRKRERWLALFWLSQNISQSEVARRLGRTRETIRSWQKSFEKRGPLSLEFCRPGGRSKVLTKKEEKFIAHLVAKKLPKDAGLKGIRWTLKHMLFYIQSNFGKTLSIVACSQILHRNRVVLKRPKKS
jgi:transposase